MRVILLKLLKYNNTTSRVSRIVLCVLFYLQFSCPTSTAQSFTNSFKINPLKVISIIENPGLYFSYEKKINNAYSLELTTSYLFEKSIWEKAFLGNNFNYLLALEAKKYLNNENLWFNYFALEFSFLHKVLQENTDEYDNFAKGIYLIDIASVKDIHKDVTTLNLKLGKVIYKNRFFLDYFFGVGLRYKDVVNNNLYYTVPDVPFKLHSDGSIDYNENREGQYFTVSIPVNIKIGYQF